MIIVGADVETNGLDPEKDEILELGLAVYDTDTSQYLALHSDLFVAQNWSKQAEDIHGIKQQSCDQGLSADFNPWSYIAPYKPTIIVAYNAEYDHSFITKRWPEFDTVAWLCAMNDLPHEKKVQKVTSLRLHHLAVDYGLLFSQAHRALDDAQLCCEIIARHDIDKVIAKMVETKYRIESWHEGRPDFSDKNFNIQREYLKKAGFRWNASTYKWIKDRVPESDLDKYMALAANKPGWKASKRKLK